jgi:AraC family transcriptional regulator, ethanolamine operon transcriptional activator
MQLTTVVFTVFVHPESTPQYRGGNDGCIRVALRTTALLNPSALQTAERRPRVCGVGATMAADIQPMATASRRVITSVDEFTDPIATAHMRPMVLGPRPMRAEIVTVDLRCVLISICDYSLPVVWRGETLPDRVLIALSSGRVRSARINGDPVLPGVVHAFGGAADVAAATAEPVRFASLSFCPAQLEQTAEKLGVEVDLPERGEYRTVRTACLAHLHRLLLEMTRSVRDMGKPAPNARGAAALADAVVELAVRCFAADADHGALIPGARLNSVRIVKVCEERAATSHYQCVTLAELCRASNVSERRIRHAFYECYGMSPTAYLRIAALNDVRQALLEAPSVRDAVSRAAYDYGFWHLSRFAAQYRALFGELPSVTVARRAKSATG